MSRFVFALIFFLLPVQALALSSGWEHDDAVSVRLVSAADAIGSDGALTLGLDVQLSNGWHTYWRTPGEAGLPPQLDWSRSETHEGNVDTATLLYPAPRRYTAYGIETVGYRDRVLFPISVRLRDAGQPVDADVGLDLLVCNSVCLPRHFDLRLLVPAGPAKPSAEASLVTLALTKLPSDPDTAGLLLESVKNDGLNLTFVLTSRDTVSAPDIFIEDDKNIGFSAPIIAVEKQSHKVSFVVKPVDNLPAGTSLKGTAVTLTVTNGDHATEMKTIIPGISVAFPPSDRHETSLCVALLFALLGGFILNLMPCVLPVLSLKILAVVSHGGGSARKVRQSFITTAAGILFSFLVLAIATIIFRHLGLSLGWGVQFQQPLFLMFLILLLTFFAINMWGLFDIPLPHFLADRIGRRYRPNLAGDFATGAFATLLATPCSAPFLGTAVGFALGSSTAHIVSIFVALGLGMSLPYLAIAVFPRAATFLPRPGVWMQHLRYALGGALALTAVWLLWVLSAQITADYAIVFGLFMAAIVALLGLKKSGVKNKLITVGLIEFCIVALILGMHGDLKPTTAAVTDRQWIRFDRNALNADIAEGKTVFLDVTADWCLTCKANMRFALSHDEIVRRLFHSDVIAMQADWTNPDPVVSSLLQSYGRYGIPFNIVYGPAAPTGIVLPELLIPDAVLRALDKASATDH